MPDDWIRHRYAEAIRSAADFSIVGEWICCDPINPDHDLCVKGDIARQMLRVALVDDCETLFVPSKLVDAVMAVRDEELEQLRLIASVNHGLHRSADDEADTWRERAETAEHALRDALPAITSGKPWEAERIIRAALDGTQDTDRG